MSLTPNPIPRLMSYVNLAQPLPEYSRAIYSWASRCGYPIESRMDLLELSNRYAMMGSQAADISAIDIGIALDVLDAHQKAPKFLERYEAFWRVKMEEAGQDNSKRFIGILALQQFFGGILLDCIETPHAVVIPQANGTYVLAGHEHFYLLNHSPLGVDMNGAEPLKESHIVTQSTVPLWPELALFDTGS